LKLLRAIVDNGVSYTNTRFLCFSVCVKF